MRSLDVCGESLHLALVADGHGGKEASVLCATTVLDLLVEALGDEAPSGAALQRAGTAAFLTIHERLLTDAKHTAGSTLTVCIVNAARAEVTTLHAGDSVARLVGRKSAALALCEDHRIESSDDERARLSKLCDTLGGTLARAMDRHGRPGGPLRLWPGSGPGVAQARVVGDRDVGAFIEPRPHACTVPLPPGESCSVLICSDGVWDAMLPGAVDGVARSTLCLPPGVSARLVCNAALAQKHAYSSEGDEIPIDDTTVIVLRIEDEDDPLSGTSKPCCA